MASAATNNMSSNNSTKGTEACLGTKTIRLRDRDTGSRQEGLVAIFHPTKVPPLEADDVDANNNHEVERLKISVTDGTAVYEGTIITQSVKMKLLQSLDDKAAAVRLAGYLLHDTVAQVVPVYSLEGCDNDNNNNNNNNEQKQVKFIIKYQTTASGDEDSAMKKAWSGNLTVCSSINSNSNSLLQFYQTLGHGINQEQQHVSRLQKDMQTVQKDRASWKETADRLSGKWESEKEILFLNFTTLYNKTRNELGTARTQISELQQQLLQQQQQQQTGVPTKKTIRKKPATKKRATTKKQITFADAVDNDENEDEDNEHQPDDHDTTFHADDMVEALASGQKVDFKTQPQSKNSNANNNRTVKQEPDSNKKSSDDDDDDDASDRPKKKKRTTANNAKTTPKSKPVAAKKKVDSPSSDDSSDSDADSVTIRIRAQIAAMKKNAGSSSSDDESDNNRGRKSSRHALV